MDFTKKVYISTGNYKTMGESIPVRLRGVKKMRLTYLLVAICLISLLGCAGSPARTQWEAETNRANMLKLNIGMNKDQVLTLMGNPYKTESYLIESKNLEFWLYLTEGRDIYDRTLRDPNFTPLAFENNFLTGWGRNYYDNALRIKQDINIQRQ